MTTPIDLIVANALNTAANNYLDEKSFARKLIDIIGPQTNEMLARSLLVKIAHEGSLANVMKALAAVGAPSTVDEVRQRFTAVVDSKRTEAR